MNPILFSFSGKTSTWKPKAALATLALSTLCLRSVAQIPLVYTAENTGSSCAAPPLPSFSQLPAIQPLPDPFLWADGRGRTTNFSDWECRRNEIKAQIENYEIGAKQPKPQNITASYAAGTTAGTGTLTVNVTVNSKTVTLTSSITLPTTGTGPFAAVIGMNSPTGSVPATVFAGRSVATIQYSHNQVTTYGNPQLTDPYYQLYPSQNLSNSGQYAAWSWGVSRLIDGLELVQASLPIDLRHLGVTGCSYAGKMALFAGALDERIALTIAQESGGGGAPAWRVSETLGAVEKLGATDYNWFKDDMKQFENTNVAKLPHDHHELMAMIAPRALLVTGNTDFEWLANPAAYVSARATHEIYKTFGLGDRFGFYIDGSHNHCAVPATQVPVMQAFVDKFLLGNTAVSTAYTTNPFPTVDYQRWYQWWGTGNPVLPALPAAPLGKRYWLEAECATVGANWDIVTADPTASQDASVRVKSGLSSPAAAPTSAAAYLVLPFTADSAATYNFLSRVNVPTGEDYSYWMKLDAGNFETVSSQLATNGGFENGLTGWTPLNINGATISASTAAADAHSGTGSLKVVNPTAQTGNQWKVQVSSAAFATTIGNQYTISYWVKAATAGGSIRLSTGPSSAQYQGDQAIGTAWQQVSWTITATLASTTFLFDMGQVANTYNIDDVSVKEVTAGGTWRWVKLKSTALTVGPHTLTIGYNAGGGTKLDKLLVTSSDATFTDKGGVPINCSTVTATTSVLAADGIEVYPNPATDNINIKLGTNQLHVQSVEVVDVLGKVLSQVSVGKQTSLSLPSDKLKPGVYLLRFKGDVAKTQRVLIQ
ncbi:MAG: T9SS type A sorting domain-containing protein [Hymenobacter sp.]|nr:MAG: T9SS type A sorting domain-containing protein [Hymenobacter sp.]